MSAIERLAMRWIEARVERDRLYKLRATFLCEHEPAPMDESPEAGGVMAQPRTGNACWKGHREEGDFPGENHWVAEREPFDWCEPCKARQQVHEQSVKARHVTTARLAALHRVCRAALSVVPTPEVSRDA